MRIDVIKAEQLTADQVAAWSVLQRADRDVDNPSFRPEFTQAVACVRDDVEVAILRDGDRTVGFFPFQRSRNNVGLPVGSVLTDMHGLVVEKDVQWEPRQLLRECGLVAWQFDHFIASQRAFAPYVKCVEDSPYMDISHGYDAYIAQRLREGGASIKRASSKARKIQREVGPLRFTNHDPDSSTLETVIKWKQQQLAEMHRVDMYRSLWVNEVVRNVCCVQNEGFSGLVSTLHAGDQLIAAMIGMRSYHVISSWIPTFNPEFRKYSPGLLLHLELAKASSVDGVRRIDLGRGLNQMKTSLASGSIPLALGAVDSRPLNRFMRHCWYKTRDLIRETPLNGFSIRYYHRVRRWLT